MQVGDLVRQRHDPQGTWLVTRIDPNGHWFTAYDFGHDNTWLAIKDYKTISKIGEKIK